MNDTRCERRAARRPGGQRDRKTTEERTLAALGVRLARDGFAAVLESEREAWGEDAAHLLGGPAFSERPALRGPVLRDAAQRLLT